MERLRLVLVGVEGSVNLGMIARLCDNFDVDEFFIVNPKASIEEAREYAARAAYRLDEAVIVDTLDEALESTTLSICTSAKTGGSILREPIPSWVAAELAADTSGVVALVMGRESVGLTREELSKCNLLANIPTSPRYRALNLANATAIMLYELYRRRKPVEQTNNIVDEKLLRLVEAYASALSDTLLIDPIKRRNTVLSIRRLVTKNIVSRREVEGLLYLMSKMCRRLDGCAEKVRSNLQSRV